MTSIKPFDELTKEQYEILAEYYVQDMFFRQKYGRVYTAMSLEWLIEKNRRQKEGEDVWQS